MVDAERDALAVIIRDWLDIPMWEAITCAREIIKKGWHNEDCPWDRV